MWGMEIAFESFESFIGGPRVLGQRVLVVQIGQLAIAFDGRYVYPALLYASVDGDSYADFRRKQTAHQRRARELARV